MLSKLGILWLAHIIVGFICAFAVLVALQLDLNPKIEFLIMVGSAVFFGIVASFTSCATKEVYEKDGDKTRVIKERATIFFIPVPFLNVLLLVAGVLVALPVLLALMEEREPERKLVGGPNTAKTPSTPGGGTGEDPAEDPDAGAPKVSPYQMPTPVREWTDVTGRTMRASLHEIIYGDKPSIRVVKEDGSEFVLGIDRLDSSGRQFVESCAVYAQSSPPGDAG